MRKVHRSALVRYSAEQMYSLVDDIESYPDFLPWCSSAVIHSRQGTIVEATLEMRRAEISKRFRTRNTANVNRSIDMQLVDGPFRHLHGSWRFTQLGTEGCKVELQLEFEFISRALDTLFGAFFEETCGALVDAFTRRAETVFAGPGAAHSDNV